MKSLKISALSLFLSFSFFSFSAKITGILDVYDIGSWAYSQHNSICKMLYPAIESGKLKPTNMTREKAMANLSETFPVFISTDPDDPTIGYDSMYTSPIQSHFERFITRSSAGVFVEIGRGRIPMEFDQTFYTLLNAEQKNYLKMYHNEGNVELKMIPIISSQLLTKLNLKLYEEGKKPTSLLYKNDSLKSTYNLKAKNQRGTQEVIAFISSDPKDPTMGYDTIWSIPYSESLKDTSKYQGLVFMFNQTGPTLKLEALSAGFEMIFYWQKKRHIEPYGYLKYPTITSLLPHEKNFLENCITSSIQSKVKLYDPNLEMYLNTFHIKPFSVDYIPYEPPILEIKD